MDVQEPTMIRVFYKKTRVEIDPRDFGEYFVHQPDIVAYRNEVAEKLGMSGEPKYESLQHLWVDKYGEIRDIVTDDDLNDALHEAHPVLTVTLKSVRKDHEPAIYQEVMAKKVGMEAEERRGIYGEEARKMSELLEAQKRERSLFQKREAERKKKVGMEAEERRGIYDKEARRMSELLEAQKRERALSQKREAERKKKEEREEAERKGISEMARKTAADVIRVFYNKTRVEINQEDLGEDFVDIVDYHYAVRKKLGIDEIEYYLLRHLWVDKRGEMREIITDDDLHDALHEAHPVLTVTLKSVREDHEPAIYEEVANAQFGKETEEKVGMEAEERRGIYDEEAIRMSELLEAQKRERSLSQKREAERKKKEEREEAERRGENFNPGKPMKRHACPPGPTYPYIDADATQKYLDSNPIPGSRNFESHRFDLPLILAGKGIKTFRHIKTISSGSYGYVCLYQTLDDSHAVAVKQGEVAEDAEVLMAVKGKCSVVNGHGFRIDASKTTILVMEAMTGNLRDFKTKYMDNKTGNPIGPEGMYKIFVVLYNLLSAFHCLYQLGLYYTDIKLENTLFNCDQGALRLYLGDLGSAVRKTTVKDKGFVVTTFPSHYRDQAGDYNPQVYDVIYGIIVLFYLLTGGRAEHLYRRPNNGSRRKAYLSSHLESIGFGPKIQPYYKLFKDMLDVRPSKLDDPQLFEEMEYAMYNMLEAFSKWVEVSETFIKPDRFKVQV